MANSSLYGTAGGPSFGVFVSHNFKLTRFVAARAFISFLASGVFCQTFSRGRYPGGGPVVTSSRSASYIFKGSHA